MAGVSTIAGLWGLRRARLRLESLPPKVSEFWSGAARVAEGASSNRRRILVGLAYALGVDAGLLTVLWLAAKSVGVALSPEALLVSYSVGTTLAIFSVTPSGVGIMEPAMLLSMTRYGVHIGTATAAIALFRLVGFWLPFGLGLTSVVAQRRTVA